LFCFSPSCVYIMMRLSYAGWDDDDDVPFILDSHA
jgi:hypothetical protein